jgi:hypothetical protein
MSRGAAHRRSVARRGRESARVASSVAIATPRWFAAPPRCDRSRDLSPGFKRHSPCLQELLRAVDAPSFERAFPADSPVPALPRRPSAAVLADRCASDPALMVQIRRATIKQMAHHAGAKEQQSSSSPSSWVGG